MNTKILIAIVAIIILIGGFFLFTNTAVSPTSQPENQEEIQGKTVGSTDSSVTSQVPAQGSEGKVDEMVVVNETTDEEETPGESQSEPAQEPTTPPASITVVTYTDNGFSPETVTVAVGESVRFENKSSSRMWVASDIHPTHSLYPEKNGEDCLGSSFDQCRASVTGESWVFTFTKAGEWRLHNHVRASKRGIVIVK